MRKRTKRRLGELMRGDSKTKGAREPHPAYQGLILDS
jgi:hypothetical protein